MNVGGDVANENNLIPFSERSESEVREINSKGGKKSGEIRRRKAAMKTAMKQLLSLPVSDIETWNKLSEMGIEPEQMDNQTALLAAVLAKGIKTGDFRTMQAVASLIGEDNEAERLKLQKKQVTLQEKKQDGAGGDGKITELIEGLKDDIHE